MGCRHYFVVDRLEEIVGEGGSRSSWPFHEHDNFQLVSQQNVAIRVFWSQCPPRLTLIARDLARDLCHGRQRVFPFYHDLLHLQRWSSYCHEMNVFVRHLARDLRHGKQRVSPFCHDLVLDLVGSIGTFGLLYNFSIRSLSNFWTQFFHPVMFQGNLWRRTRWHTYLLVYDFSSFHPNNFRNTKSWKCFVKNDSVRSCLIELQSFLQSKIDVDPIHCVLMFLPCFVHVLCMTRCIQVDRIRILMVFVHRIHKKKEYCLSFAQSFGLPVSILDWWWNVNWLHTQNDICTGRNRSE